MYIWEILHLTIRKMSKYVNRLTRELEDLRERQRSGDSSSGEDSDSGGRRNKPTEEMLEKKDEQLEQAQSDQKNLFLIIFQVVSFFNSTYGFFFLNH